MSIEIEKKNAMREKLLVKLLPVIRKEGVSSLRIERIAKIMDISKATMYKYFSSKEEIIESIVDLYVSYITDIGETIVDHNASYSEHFQKSFEQSLLIAFYISNEYLNDLQTSYPTLYEKISDAHDKRNEQISHISDQYQNEGIFNPINIYLLHMQDQFLLRKLFDPALLTKMNMTLYEALLDYYSLTKHQLIHPEYLNEIDDNKIHELLKKLVQKFSTTM
ncbi:TetR/AcrR family transcriptional regulator [Bacillus solimangrovi]|uniref:HTH tetR-type domain-containing protein n=1 Tax=Bacillus solimangrovi TaxID=1305675 RepID=A0A1E5LJC0_9BACI|nr:TetR/AcrR family transcriptional regulator [Bacillus solimangrovi]OEH94192.1 hypothetical protein BFG57_09070 [Bacillus solimangrovi]